MGTRVHKILGFALSDIVTDEKGNLTDPRLNPSGILFDGDEEHFSFGGYADWLKKRREEYPEGSLERLDIAWEHKDVSDWANGCGWRKNQRRPQLHQCFIRTVESGMPDVLMIVPLQMFDEWYRYDDIFDYIEESTLAGPQNRLTVLSDCVYPYLGKYWDCRTGRKVDSGAACAMRRFINATTEGEAWRTVEGGNELAKVCGFESIAEAVEFMVPYPPTGLQLLCEYANVFNEPSAIWQLRPAIYVYWG